MKRLLLAGGVLAAAVAAVAAVAVCGGGAPPVGEAALDTSVYVDPARDAQMVEAVVKQAPDVSAPRPNVVVILADDLGYGDVGAFGARGIRTPSLDRLAREGVRFTHFYASGVYCSPSRAGLLTGRYPLRTGVNFPIQPEGDTLGHRLTRLSGRITARIGAADLAQAGESAVPGLPASEITLPESLKLAGYATGMVGKWHLGDFDHDLRHHPRRHGFDFFAGFPASNDEFPYSYWRDEERVEENLGLALPVDRVIDGRDLWPLLSGAQTQSPHEGLFFFNANVIDGVRAGRWA